MKYIYILLLLLGHSYAVCQRNLNQLLIFESNRVICDSVDNPFIYSGQCEIGIGRILSKNVAVYGLSQYNNSEPCYGDIAHTDTLYNCTPPYNLCFGKCSQKYWEIIKGAVDLQATMLIRAGSIAGKEYSFHTDTSNVGSDWRNYSYSQCSQLVKDVNKAFDCAGLPRPVIQGEILELPINFQSVNIKIPDYVIDSFLPQMNTIDSIYYSTQRHFIWQRMKLIDESTNKEYQNIDSIESRMWIYYVASTFIDMGYTAIHMGIYPIYANKNTIDPGYLKLGELTTMIRSYAISKGSFVLLNGETGIEESPKIGNSNQLIFDFDSRAIRPHEIESINSGDFGCNENINIDNTVFNFEPCNNEGFPAIIDTCVTNQFGGSTGGISPTGCTFQKVPYILHWDFGTGVLGKSTNDSCFIFNDSIYGPSEELTYGFEDTRWFGELLSDNCKAEWLMSMYCQFRNQLQNDGFLMMPLLLTMKYPEEYDYQNCELDSIEPIADGAYMMTDDSTLINNISEFLMPLVPSIQIDSICDDINYCSYTCNDFIAPPRYRYRYGHNVYKFSINNSDCTSLYSWHIFNLKTNQWLPQSLGKERKFSPPNSGNYIVILRQDNLGIQPYSDSYGVYEIRDTLHLYSNCCDDLVQIGTPCTSPIIENSKKLISLEISERESRISEQRQLISIAVFNSIGQLLYLTTIDESSENLLNKLEQLLTTGIYYTIYQYSDGLIVPEYKLHIK